MKFSIEFIAEIFKSTPDLQGLTAIPADKCVNLSDGIVNTIYETLISDQFLDYLKSRIEQD